MTDIPNSSIAQANLQDTISYVGHRVHGGTSVLVRRDQPGQPYPALLDPLPPRLDLRNHSPTGFEWGYGGSGPAQLALAILAHCTGDDDYAKARYQAYKWEVVSSLPHECWSIPSAQVQEWVDAHPLPEGEPETIQQWVENTSSPCCDAEQTYRVGGGLHTRTWAVCSACGKGMEV